MPKPKSKYTTSVRYLTNLTLLIDSPKLTAKDLEQLTQEFTNLLADRGIDLVAVNKVVLERSLKSRRVPSD